MAVQVHNTLSRRREPFVPANPPKVTMYVCGMTAYEPPHIGHARSAVAFDIIVRYLRYRGYDVTYVTNFTDVDDKIIEEAKRTGEQPLELSERIIREYFADLDPLCVARADLYPKASETIPEIIRSIRRLVDGEHAYTTPTGVYFAQEKFPDYGKLSGQEREAMRAGERVEVDESKLNPLDFALWKAAKPGEISWPSPWGPGRPGWHIECSAMVYKHLGSTVDIHGGGADLLFPHHENELLQSEALNGAPLATYWLHNGLVTVRGEKMAHSLENFFTVREALRRFPPEVIRFYCVNAHYRQPIAFDEASLPEAARSLERLHTAVANLEEAARTASGSEDGQAIADRLQKEFEENMDDDFNSRGAIATLFEAAREANRLIQNGALSQAGAQRILAGFRRVDDVLRILKPVEGPVLSAEELSEIERLIGERQAARARRDFAEADRIRAELLLRGIKLEDRGGKVVWHRRRAPA